MHKIILATALTLMCSSAFAADDMNKPMTNGTSGGAMQNNSGSMGTPMNDGQKSSTTGMSNDGLNKGGMSKDGMNKNMSKDNMKKDGMSK